MPSLATTADLVAYVSPRTVHLEQAQLALDLASGLVRAETGQTLHYVENDVAELRGSVYPELILPERPVVSVSAVAIDGVPLLDGDYVWRGDRLIRSGGWPEVVTVIYSHGYRTIPDDVRLVCLALAARIVASNSAESEVASETIGNYSVSYLRTATLGSSLMLDGERELLRRTYRRTAGMVSLR